MGILTVDAVFMAHQATDLAAVRKFHLWIAGSGGRWREAGCSGCREGGGVRQ